MKNRLFSFFTAGLVAVLVFCCQNAMAQCPGCGKSSFQTGATLTPGCSSNSQSAGSGTYVRFNVTSGVVYTFGTASSFNTDITGYNGGSCVFHRNGNTGNGTLNWTANFTGSLDIMVNRDNCQGHDFTGVSAVLTYQKTAPTSASAGADQTACVGSATMNANNPSIGSGSWTSIPGGVSPSSSSSRTQAFSNLNGGNNTFTWTTNNGGCTSSDNIVVFNDNVAPSANCQNRTVVLNSSGNGSLTASSVNNGSSDAHCSISLSLSQTSYGCGDVGNQTETLTVTDQNGNSSTCTATITTEDNTNPLAVCQSRTVVLNSSGNGSLTASDVNNGSSDACGITLSLSQTSYSCSDVGTQTETLTVGDGNGNSSTCTAVITTQDNTNPTAVCQNQTVTLNSSGNGSLAASQVNNGSSDACGVSLSLSQTSYGCGDVGTQTETLTVSDPSSNSTACTATVTTVDVTNPVAVCQNRTVVLNSSGSGSLTASDVNNGSSDACGISLSLSQTSYTCSDVGSQTETLTVTDPSGNSSNCTATVTTQDNTNPAAMCQHVTVTLNASGTGSTTATSVNNGSSDACAGLTFSLTQTSFGCSDVGSQTETLTVTDANSNSSTCTATITTQDVTNPVAVCQNVTVVLNSAGNGSTSANAVDNGSSDACGISKSLSQVNYNCSDVGGQTETLTITDPSGNSASCTATVTTQDNTFPSAVCQNRTVTLNAVGNGSLAAADVDNGSSDACTVSLTLSQTSFGCGDVGTQTETLTATDPSGNATTCTANITTLDITNPTAVCQDITVQLNSSGNGTTTAGAVDNGSADACGVSLSINNSSFNCSNVGDNTTTLTVTDPSSNSVTCSATVTVEDNIAPDAVCVDQTLQLTSGGAAITNVAATDGGSTDACGIANTTISQNLFGCGDIGQNTITLNVTDVNGNLGTCPAVITVQDITAPNAVCQNVTVPLNAGGVATLNASNVDNGSSDGCGVSFSVSPNSFDCNDIGNNNLTLTVTDPTGNSATCTAVADVQDVLAPTAVCKNFTLQLDNTGNGSITTNDVNNGSADGCGAALSVTPVAYDCSDVGSNTATLTATDPYGNSSNCTSTITVQDNVVPVAVCQSFTTQLDASGNGSVTGSDLNNGSSDACGIASYSATPSAFTCANVGGNFVTVTVTDNNSNSSTCGSIVTVQDNVVPVAVCQNVTVTLNSSGNGTLAAATVNNGSSDACSITLSLTQTSYSCSDVGDQTETLTATDPSGNTGTCAATVSTVDATNPVAICQDVTVVLNSSGAETLAASAADNGSNDACGVTLSISQSAYTCADVGSQTETLTVTDPSGNSSTCTTDVTTQDNTNAVAVCQDITVQLDAGGNASITSDDIDNGSSDACGISTKDVFPASFTCANVGNNTATLIITDVNSNTSNCTAQVTVQDNVQTNAVCQDTDVFLDVSGNGSITTGDVDDGSSDACGIQSYSLNQTAFTCSDVGQNFVTLTLTDVNGNTSSCQSEVNVHDILVTALCQNYTLQLDSGGNGTVTSGDVDNSSTDACGIASYNVMPSAFSCADAGNNTVTLSIQDVNGNVGNCLAVVSVVDNTAPTALCMDATIQLDVTGNATLTTNDVDNGSGDACGVGTATISQSAFTCAHVGNNNVTLTLTDDNSNTSNCVAVVTVQDNVVPAAVCNDLTIQLDAGGNANITTGDVDNGSSDACGVASLAISTSAFTCANVGNNTVGLTVTDNNSNTASCMSNVTVQDVTAPVAVCQDLTLQLDAAGSATITSSDIDNGSSDACGGLTYALSSASFGCADVGTNAIVLTITDVNGNNDNCNANVTVQDNVDPVAVCQNHTLQLDASGNGTITDSDIDNGSSDACGIASLVLDQTAFNCSHVGTQTVSLTVTDNNSNFVSCSSQVTVIDNVVPTAICQDATINLDAGGSASITTATLDNGSSDACGISGMTLSASSFGCNNTGDNSITLTVTDNNTNSATCESVVTIVDNTNPTAICQDITIQLDAVGMASITASDINNGSSDACSITISASQTAFSCGDVGTVNVTLTATDPSSNTGTCVSAVEIQDNVAPTAICQAHTVLLDASGNGSLTTGDIDNGSNDACGIQSLAVDIAAFTCADEGGNTVELTVTDVNGNTASCTSNVTVIDNVAPVVTCQNYTLMLDVNGSGTVATGDIDNGSSDACGYTLTVAPSTFGCVDLGNNTVTLSGVDANGNTGSCDATVLVLDQVAPMAICKDITMQLNVTGSTPVTGSDIDNGSADACGITISVSPTSYGCGDVGPNNATLTVTDPSANVSTCVSVITVEDNIAPTVSCQDITIELSPGGTAAISDSAVLVTTADACGVPTVSVSPSTFDCNVTGANVVTLTSTDVNGNDGTCTANVTAEDNVGPVAVCQDITVQLDTTGNAAITANDVDNGSNDACSITMTVSPNSFVCGNVGSNNVTLTVTDVGNNIATCSGDVMIEDNVRPAALCQDITIQLDAAGNVSITTADVDNNSADACGIATKTLSQTAFVCAEVGANPEVLTVTDVNGNISTCATVVNVEDNVTPIAICQDATVQLDASGNGSTTTADVDNGSNDACGIATKTLSQTDFVCNEVGGNTEVLTVTDVNGNVSTCSATITVEDNVPANAICQNVTIQLDSTGNASTTANDINNGSNDACGVANIALSQTAFTCPEIGSQTEVLTVTDINGNISTCSAFVNVQDNIAPTAICQDITIQLDVNGNASITTGDVDGGSHDNCNFGLSVSNSTFGCNDVGLNKITLTATDHVFNTGSCRADVIVEDTIPAVAVCQDLTVYLDANGDAQVTPNDPDNGSNDACGIASLVISQQDYVCGEVGPNAETLTVTDENGNVSQCGYNVTIIDSVSPVAICTDLTIQLDGTGNASITTNDVDNGSSDACTLLSKTISQSAFDCSHLGINPVTLTVVDVNSNSSNCQSDVLVQDVIAPVAICQDITVQLDADGMADITTGDIDNGSNDECVTMSMALDKSHFTCNEVGPVTVVLSVTDNDGNITTCSSNVDVQDNVAPIANCQDITVQLDAAGNVSITTADVDDGSSDACGISMTVAPNTFTCNEVGLNAVVLTVTDANSNVTTCPADVTVEDNVLPVAVCTALTIQLDNLGAASITTADLDAGSTDACGIASLAASQEVFECQHLGVNTVSLTVTDINGNVGICSTTVIVEDVIAPIAYCQDATVTLDVAGNGTITTGDVDAGSNDICGNASSWINGVDLEVDPADFTCADVGVNSVTLFVTDSSGNSSNCIANVTVNTNANATINAIGSTALCNGSDVTLTASPGGATYQWYKDGQAIGGATAQDYVATTGGDYQVQLVGTLACDMFSSVITVTSGTVSASISSGGVTEACENDGITLTASPSGMSYVWFHNGTIINGASSETYDALTSGDYAVRVTDANGCSDQSAPVTLVINPNPVADAGPDVTLVSGNSVQIGGSPTATGGTTPYSYLWLPFSDISDPLHPNPSISPTITTQYMVSVKDGRFCTDVDTMVATVWGCQMPTSLAVDVVNSTTADVSWDAVPGATGYTLIYRVREPGEPWTILHLGAVTSTTISTLLPATEYSFRIRSVCSAGNSGYDPGLIVTTYSSNTCDMPANITFNPIRDDRVKITWAPSINATRYQIILREAGTTQWIVRNTNAPAHSRWIAALQPGTTYQVRMRSDCPNGFTAWTPIQTFTTTGTARLSQTDGVASLDLYPNPATGFTFINYDAAGLGNVEMAVYDAFGRIMFSQRVSDETGTIRLDTHGWPSGTYSIRLGNGSNASVTKLTVIK